MRRERVKCATLSVKVADKPLLLDNVVAHNENANVSRLGVIVGRSKNVITSWRMYLV
jgi:hypothetical protein